MRIDLSHKKLGELFTKRGERVLSGAQGIYAISKSLFMHFTIPLSAS